MSNNDWQQIEELFHATLALPREERDLYLSRACDGNAALQSEVQSLIAAFESRPELLEEPAISLGMKLMTEETTEAPALSGRMLGQYKVLDLLGQGGMGQVYLAEDEKLGRQVALKFLYNKSTDDAWAMRQFTKEARALARLDHPTICPVYGFEEIDGYHFMVMQYVEGETLASLISRGLLEPAQIAGLAAQIVTALEIAHSHGIIHRDVKPQNIMVTATGQVKVLDFGLAKLVQQEQAAPNAGDSESLGAELGGLVIGTLAYMSPEQLRHERLDFRSDVFSFGVVLYEMMTGTNPYVRGSNAEIISAILTSDPEPPKNLPADLPKSLVPIALRCLNRDKEQRYQSASELLTDLENLDKVAAARRQKWSYLTARLQTALILTLLLVIVGAYVYSRMTRIRTLAVLPIANESTDSDLDYLATGLSERLVDRLSHLSKLRVKAPTVVSFYNGQHRPPQQIGRDLSVDNVLVGSLTTRGLSSILHVELVDTSDGSRVWGKEYGIRDEELTILEELLSSEICSELHVSLNGDDRKLLAAHETENPEAHKLYLLGRYYWRKRDSDNIRKAIDYFGQAIKLSPLYAQAYAGLADSYVLMTSVSFGAPMTTRDAMTKAKVAANMALQIDDHLCEAYTSLGMIELKYEWNWQTAERDFKRAIELNADYAPAHSGYSTLLALTRRFKESISESEIARDLDPFSTLSVAYVGRAFYYARQYDKAAEAISAGLEMEPESQGAAYLLSLTDLQRGFDENAIASLEKLYSVNDLLASAALGFAYAKVGRTADAQRVLDRLELRSRQTHVPAQERAIIHIGLGNKDQAFKLLQQDYDERFALTPLILIEPLFDTIRSDPRYTEFAYRFNLSP